MPAKTHIGFCRALIWPVPAHPNLHAHHRGDLSPQNTGRHLASLHPNEPNANHPPSLPLQLDRQEPPSQPAGSPPRNVLELGALGQWLDFRIGSSIAAPLIDAGQRPYPVRPSNSDSSLFPAGLRGRFSAVGLTERLVFFYCLFSRMFLSSLTVDGRRGGDRVCRVSGVRMKRGAREKTRGYQHQRWRRRDVVRLEIPARRPKCRCGCPPFTSLSRLPVFFLFLAVGTRAGRCVRPARGPADLPPPDPTSHHISDRRLDAPACVLYVGRGVPDTDFDLSVSGGPLLPPASFRSGGRARTGRPTHTAPFRHTSPVQQLEKLPRRVELEPRSALTCWI